MVAELLASFVPVPAQIQDQPSDGIRGVSAIVQKLLPGSVAGLRLVLAEGGKEVFERLLGYLKLTDGRAKGDEDRVNRFTLVAEIQVFIPFIQELQRALRIPGFIGQVVRNPAVSIDVGKMLAQSARQQKRDYREVFVMAPGERATKRLCLFLADALAVPGTIEPEEVFNRSVALHCVSLGGGEGERFREQ